MLSLLTLELNLLVYVLVPFLPAELLTSKCIFQVTVGEVK